jgi:hypothetical protein
MILVFSFSALGYETDPYSHRLIEITDATEHLNEKVNQALKEVVKNWKGPENKQKLVKKVYLKLGGRHWVDKIERYVNQSTEIEKLPTKRYQSIYAPMPKWVTRVNGLMGIGPIFKLNHQLVGTDKLGHFFSQGKKFYFRYLKTNSVQQAAARSAYTERAIFGQATTGTYSNADLVANYEGFLFYRSFFEDDVIPGKKAMFIWQNEQWIMQRSFDWRDHVNAYWDEAININYYDKWLQAHMKDALVDHCDDYINEPNLYKIDELAEQRLTEKYRKLKLLPNEALKMNHLCTTNILDNKTTAE